MSFKHILSSSVRFFVFQSKDMAMMPELQPGYAVALLTDRHKMNPNLIRIQSVYPYKAAHDDLTKNISLYPEECYVFFIENFYHSSSFALKEVEALLPLINKKVFIHSVKLTEFESERLMRDYPCVEMVIRTDIEYAIHQELTLGCELLDMANITFRKDGQVISTPKADVTYNLSDCILPAYTSGKVIEEKDSVARVCSFIDPDDEFTDARLVYRRPKKMQMRVLYEQERSKEAMICSGRGCKYKCSYCFRGVKYSAVRQIPLDVIEADLAYLKSIGIVGVYFYDDCFVTTNKDRVDSIINLMLKYDFYYYIALRYEACNPDILSKLSRLKFYNVQIGLQSITHNADHKRSFNHDKMVQAVDVFKRSGSTVSIDLILGLPGETKEDFEKTLQYAISLSPKTIVVNTLFLNPGTELNEKKDKFGIVVSDMKLNVPYLYESNTFSRRDIVACREFLKTLSDKMKHITFVIR